MKIHITDGSIGMTAAVKNRVETRLVLALNRFSEEIAQVNVKLTDGDGSSPGAGKKCLIEVLLSPSRKIVVEDEDSDLHVAVDRAAAQMARSVERKLIREREFD